MPSILHRRHHRHRVSSVRAEHFGTLKPGPFVERGGIRMHTRFLLALAAALVMPGCIANMTELKSTLGAEEAVAPPLAPAAKAMATPTLAKAGEAVRFTAYATTDPQASPLDFAWSFGDGGGAYGVEVTHAYAAAGSYSVTLTARNALGVADVDVLRVEVVAVDPEPVARASATPAAAFVNQPVDFSASASYDPAMQALRYLWDFGDGASAATATARHAFASPGVHTVTLTVLDANGQESRAQVRIPVSLMENRSGIVDATASRVDLPLAVPASPDTLRLVLTFDGAPANDLRLEVRDASGRIVDMTGQVSQVGTGTAALELSSPTGAFGTWTLSVVRHTGVRANWALSTSLLYG